VKVLDTDTCVAILRSHGQVIERRAGERDDVVTTWVTAAELYFGAAKSAAPGTNRLIVDEFLDTLPVLAPDIAAAQVFGEAKALLQKAGTPLADADLFIAALAITHGAAIVTGNHRHFERIPGVVVEDWIRG
jgi:tRNA(fMet)-specific endonuclease VapC